MNQRTTEIDRRVIEFVSTNCPVAQGKVVSAVPGDPHEVAESVRNLQEINALQRDEHCMLVPNPWFNTDD